MTIETKIFAVCRMYLKALEENDSKRKAIFQKRADALYQETHTTDYNMTWMREHILFSIAMGEEGYYFRSDLRKVLKNLSAA